MSEIILDLSGQKGLADDFHGDVDMVTPRPELRIAKTEGDLVQGLFNPYLRKGYLAPTTTTAFSITTSDTPANGFGSIDYDHEGDIIFIGGRDQYIRKIGGLLGTLSTVLVTLPESSAIVHDLELYQINNKKKLLYSYLRNKVVFESDLSVRGNWTSVAVRVDPYSGDTLSLNTSFEGYAESASFTTEEFTIASGTNIEAIIFVATYGAPNTSITTGGGAATLIDSWTRTQGGVTVYYYLYNKLMTAGTKDVAVVNSSSVPTLIKLAVFNGASLTPVTEYNKTHGSSYSTKNILTANTGSEYLEFIIADNDTYSILNPFSFVEYNASAQTTDTGQSIAFSTDGTKMYLDGRPASTTSIFQYTLSTAWDITSATYSTKSKLINSQIPSAVSGMQFSTDGTKLVMRGYNGTTIRRWTLSTAWDISTATYESGMTFNIPETNLTFSSGLAFSEDGTEMFICNFRGLDNPESWVSRYTLSTPWNPFTAVFTSKAEIPRYCREVVLSNNDSVITFVTVNDNYLYSYNFNPLYPYDITRLTLANTNGVDEIDDVPDYSTGLFIAPTGGKYYFRGGTTLNYSACKLSMSDGLRPEITTNGYDLFNNTADAMSSSLTHRTKSKVVEIGYIDMSTARGYTPDSTDKSTWLADTQGVVISSESDYNFIRKADNGFAYLFAENAVHKIDGGFTGGVDGTLTKNVLLFPDYFTITDAVDYRSRLYIAVHQYPVSVADTSLNTFTGKCGIYVWNRISTQLSSADFIELPGVREIKKIFASPDGQLKLITISDNGITQLRQFGYNDSGGVVFPVVKTLGIGAYPQFPDGLTTAGDKVMWLANDGKIYCNKDNYVTQLFQVKTPGTTTATLESNISSGILFYGNGDGTADTGYRSNKQALIFSYLDGATHYIKRVYPFDLKTKTNSVQTPHQGDVYTGVTLIPVTSIVRNVRIYNAAITGTGSTVVATVKLYFNRSATVGMTKTITKDEAKRGYVDFKINKPYINAIQIEIEWSTAITLDGDLYLPNAAVITHDATDTKSPDNG